MADLDAIHTNSTFRTVHPTSVPRVILPIIELVQACPNQRHVLLLVQSYEEFHLTSK